ncbi:hypothetical protein GPALN_005959 [Globodera pallida]|nr:hypothetical protein GPALN_005959 [Globodera pallida]
MWHKFLPFITIFVYLVPTFFCCPMFKMNTILIMNYPNSTTDRSFFVYEAGGDAPYWHNEYLIEKKLLFYALATFLGARARRIQLFVDILHILYLLLVDTGTVVLSSWLLLWASGTFRQQLIKDFGIIRKINIQNIRVDAQEAPRNNNHWAVGGAVGHQLQNRFCSSVQQLPTIS